jgi:hypothetical protein
MHAKDLQAFDLFHIGSRAFSAFSETLEQNGSYLISFILRCR